MATRWRWPPDRRVPRSPSTVSYRWGSCSMNWSAFAALAAASTWARVADGEPYAMLACTVSLSRTVSWLTTPRSPRSERRVSRVNGTPSIVIRPPAGS